MRNEQQNIDNKLKALQERSQRLQLIKKKMNELSERVKKLDLQNETERKQPLCEYTAEVKQLSAGQYLLTIWDKNYEMISQSREITERDAIDKIIALTKDVHVTFTNKAYSFNMLGENLENFDEIKKEKSLFDDYHQKLAAYDADRKKYDALKLIYMIDQLGRLK
jgi:hypothetical protein